MKKVDLTPEQIKEIHSCVSHSEYCSYHICEGCPLEDEPCEDSFYKVKYGAHRDAEQEPYSPTRLDYFVARIMTGYMANENMIMDMDQIVKIAKSLIKEIDKQEGAS